MALIRVRVRGWWGTAEIVATDEDVYESTEVKPLGVDAKEPGVGVRRCVMVWDRNYGGQVEDAIQTSFDFLKMSGESALDTWETTDFQAIENLLNTFWGTWLTRCHTSTILAQYRWYRIGKGIGKPNPAFRITPRNVPGTKTSNPLPPQIAVTVTEKTAVRRAWGRTYLPGPTGEVATLGTQARIPSSLQDELLGAAAALYDGAAAADYLPVVYSKTKGKVYGVETIQVDDIYDVQRPRRFKKPLRRVTNPVGP